MDNELEIAVDEQIIGILLNNDRDWCRKLVERLEHLHRRYNKALLGFKLWLVLNVVCVIGVGFLLGKFIYAESYFFAMGEWLICTLNIFAVWKLSEYIKNCRSDIEQCVRLCEKVKEVLKIMESIPLGEKLPIKIVTKEIEK